MTSEIEARLTRFPATAALNGSPSASASVGPPTSTGPAPVAHEVPDVFGNSQSSERDHLQARWPSNPGAEPAQKDVLAGTPYMSNQAWQPLQWAPVPAQTSNPTFFMGPRAQFFASGEFCLVPHFITCVYISAPALPLRHVNLELMDAGYSQVPEYVGPDVGASRPRGTLHHATPHSAPRYDPESRAPAGPPAPPAPAEIPARRRKRSRWGPLPTEPTHAQVSDRHR